jgi:hypothetical protein
VCRKIQFFVFPYKIPDAFKKFRLAHLKIYEKRKGKEEGGRRKKSEEGGQGFFLLPEKKPFGFKNWQLPAVTASGFSVSVKYIFRMKFELLKLDLLILSPSFLNKIPQLINFPPQFFYITF